MKQILQPLRLGSMLGLIGISMSLAPDALGATDLQSRLTTPTETLPSVIQKYDLIRLWEFTDSKHYEAERIMGDGRNATQGSKLFNTPYNIENHVLCEKKSFPAFRQGMVESDETLLVSKILDATKPTPKAEFIEAAEKSWRKLYNDYPSITPNPDNIDFTKPDQLQPAITPKENQTSIRQSTSLLEVKKTRQNTFYLNASDYTVGGWFKPDPTAQRMTLFTKKFSDKPGLTEIREWTIYIDGNEIFFHNYREEGRVYSKYLSEIEATQFRMAHADFYDVNEYYDDVLQKTGANQSAKAAQAVPLQKIFLEMPTPPTSKKPPGLPPILPGPLPPVTPLPPGPIPVPPTPIPYPIPPGTGKEYTARFDMKKFWWSAQLGSCYQCLESGRRHEAWYYLSFSVHLNDPLGPYVDLVIIQDPNERVFADRPTFNTHYRTARWELDRRMLSRPALTPFTSAAPIERQCSGASCVKSVLQIGSVNKDMGYWGSMRGIYIAKKALRPEQMLEMASQYYPNDNEQCTYTDKVP